MLDSQVDLGGVLMSNTFLRTPSRPLSVLVSWALLLPMLVVGGVTFGAAGPAAAAAELVVTKSAPRQALVGDPVTFEITARNPGDAPFYNLSLRDVLPTGLTYESTATAAAGEPQAIPAAPVPAGQQQTLIWSNVADLQPNSSFTLVFTVTPDATVLPVGAAVTNVGQAFASAQPRVVPRFDADGVPIASANVQGADSGPQTTQFSAIEVRKSEPSPEGELLRGVHDNTTTYTLEIQDNDALATNDVTVLDYLPAALEFLHCGDVDNSPTGLVEYDGADRLTVVPPPAGDGICPPIGGTSTPRIDSIDTVTLAAGNPQGYPAGVYTRVEYVLGDLDPAETVTLKYRAGIPMNENVAFTDPVPAPESGEQAANLANNTGPSTRENGGEQSITNHVSATGIYTGPILDDPDGGPVSASDEATRTVEDLAMVKTVSPNEFTQGQIATYTLTLNGSEYVASAGIVVTDVLPNGVCPLAAAGTPGAAADCLDNGANTPSTPYASYVVADDGTTTISFEPVSVAQNGTTTITYSARMRNDYGGTSQATGGLAGQPIATGDSFTNDAELTGTSTSAVTGGQSQESGEAPVVDDSQVTLTSTGGSLDKALKPRDSSFALAYDCDGPSTGDPTSSPTPFGNTEDFLAAPGFDRNRLAFRKGDRICFQITARFSETTQTRNAVIGDFLPVGTSYEANSFRLVGPTGVGAEVGENNLPEGEVLFNETAAAAGTQDPIWLLGRSVGDGLARSLPPGAVFQGRFAVIVDRAPEAGGVEIVGNLVKMRIENSAGQAQSFRDREDFGIIPPPPLATVKGVASVNGDTQPWNPTTGNDGIEVKQGDLVTYRVDLSNEGTLADANVVEARQIELWDVLPVGITCADVVPAGYTYDPSVNDAMTVQCYDAGAAIPTTPPAGRADTTTPTGRSVIRWKDTAVPDSIDGTETARSNQNALWSAEQVENDPAAPDDATSTRSYLYQVRVPAQVSVGASLPNTAGVRSYGVLNSLQNVVPYFPEENIDSTVPVVDRDAPRSRDDSEIFLPRVIATKGVTSAIDEPGNVGAETAPAATTQAVPGEVVTYTVAARLPAQTTVYNATFTEPLPAGQQLLSAEADWSATGAPGGPWTALPAGVTLDTTTTATAPTLRFGQVYNNATSTDQLFRMTITARVLASAPANAQGAAVRNTATFSSTPAVNGTGTPLTAQARATVNMVEPRPTITKSTTGDVNGTVLGGQSVTFTLEVDDTAGRPPLHDSWVVDCVPSGLESPTYTTTTPAGIATLTPEPGTGTLDDPGNGCPTGTTRLAWNLGLLQAGAPTVELNYTVTVTTTAVGAQFYTNTATVSGNSLAGERTDPTQPGNTDGRPYSQSNSRTLTVAGAGSFKSVDKPNATIGEIVTYTISAELPPNVNFYDVALIDSLPVGVVPEPTVGDSAVVSTQCRSLAGDPCDPDITPVPLTAAPDPADPNTANRIGLFLGDLGPSTQLRIVQVVYTARVVDVPANTTGTDLVNSVVVRWNTVDGQNPTSVNPPTQWTETGTPRTTTVNVTQPLLSITKNVNDTSVDPGQTFTYTVRVSNASGPDVSAAFDATVTDAVPAGVIVDPATLAASGGVLSGTNADGSAGRITWTLPGPLAPGTSRTFAYSAKLAASPTINATGKRNTADIGTYYSLPSDYEFGFPGGALNRREYDGPSAARTVTPQFPALLAAKTTPNGPIAYVGDQFAWRFTVTNTGSSAARDVDLIDVLPPNWRYQPDSASVTFGAGAAQALNPTLSLDGAVQTLTWTDAGNLAPTQVATVTFRAVPLTGATTNPGAGSDKAHTNTVRAAADDTSGASGNLTGPYESNVAPAIARIHAADVAIDKTAGDFVAGATGTFTLVVRNNGTDPAVGPFQVTDPIPTTPAGLTHRSATGAGWSCGLQPVAGTPGTVVCSRTNGADTLTASGAGAQFAPIVITVAVADDVASGTTYDNTGSVTAKTFDPNLTNNSDPATATVRAEADLTIVKKLSGQLVAGRDATYTLDVTNLGPSVSRADIVVRDTLPPGAEFLSAAGEGWDDCTEAAGVVTCTRSTDLAVGENAGQVTLKIGIPSAQADDVVNIARVSGTTPETTLDNNESRVTTPVTRSADLTLEKSHVGDLIAGQTGTYELQVANFGPSDAAANVTITDTLPDGLTFDSVTSTSGDWGCTAAGQGLTCTRGTEGGGTPSTMPAGAGIGAGMEEVLTITVAIGQDLPTGDIANSATIKSPTPDPNPGNNTDDDLTGTDTLADLSIVKTVPPDEVTAGEQVTYTLQVANGGPSVARQLITVTDVLPAGLSWPGPGSATGDGWACAYTAADRTVTCTRGTDLAAPAAPSDDPIEAPPIRLVLDVDPDAGPATIVNAADVDSPTNDPDLTNNTDEVPVVVVDAVNVSLAKSHEGTEPVTAGTQTTFTLLVTNDGPSDADSVVVLDTMPDGLIPLRASGEGWNCAEPVGQTITCDRPTLAADPDGAPATGPPITVEARVDASVPDGTPLENSATVSTSTPGDDPADNTGTAVVPVRAVADLTLTKAARALPEGETLEAGEQVTYDLVVTNGGDSDAVADVVVVDTVPLGFTFAGTAGTGWECTAAPDATDPPATGEVITCTLGEDPDYLGLAAGATAAALSVLVSIDPTVRAGEYTNNAVVSTPTDERTEDNNDASETVTVGEGADLSITKSHTGTVRVGDPLGFSLLVRNEGPSVARGVVVTDELPTGLTYESGTGEGWTCTTDDQLVTCELDGALDPLAETTIDLTVTVEPSAYPGVVNPASVASETPDSDDSNNSDTDEVTVPPLTDLAVAKSHEGTFQVGQQASYAILVTNNGPTPAPDVVITDTLPTGLEFVSASGAGVACSAEGQLVTCTADEPMAVDAQLAITLTVEVLPTAYPGATNIVSVTSPAEETDTVNNTAQDPAVVDPLVGLELTKELISQDDDRALFEIVVTNNGPNATVEPIVVVDDLPVGLELVAAQGTGWECGVTEPVTCTHPTSLAVGASASFGVVATITAPPETTVTNVATATAGCSPTPAASDGDVQAAVTVPVDCGRAEADLTTPPEAEAGGSGDGDGDGSDNDGLADTGARVGSLALLAVAFIALGGAAVMTSRGRREA